MPENNVTDQEKHAYINHIDQQLQQLDFIVYDHGCCCQVARRKHRVTDKIIKIAFEAYVKGVYNSCLLYTSPSPRDLSTSRMPSSA